MNQSDQLSASDFRLGEWLVQPSLNRISRGDEKITLELKWMDVLVCLAERPGELVSRQEINDTVWATEFITDNTLTHTVAELRNALGDDANDPTYIETIRGRGYRLLAPVERLDDEGVSHRPESGVATSRRRWRYVVATAIAAVIALVVIFSTKVFFERRGTGPDRESPPRIVVLPFENLGPPEDEYFADGITEEITSRLTAVSGLQVISRTSAMFYKNREVPLRQIGDELGVSHVIEGTIRWEKSGKGSSRVRINSQLIRVADDSHIWSQRYDRDFKEIFAVQADIAEQVTAQLQATIRESERGTIKVPPTENMEAYQAYLLGLQHSRSGEDSEDLLLSVSMLERAVDLDPEFALAWALLAERRGTMYHYSHGDREEHRSAAKHAVEMALALDPDLPEAHRAMGFYHYFCHLGYEKALASFARTLAERPNDTGTLAGVGYILRRQGRWKESTDRLEQVLALEPKDYGVTANIALNYACLREYDRAEEYAKTAISLAPDKSDGYVITSDVYRWLGKYREAREVLESAPAWDPWIIQLLVASEIGERRFDEALARLQENPDAVYEALWGKETGALVRAEQMCDCFFFLKDRPGVQAACGRARELAEERVAVDSENPSVRGKLARVLAALGQKEDAIREGKKAIELLPVSKEAVRGPNHVRTMAIVYTRVSEFDSAIDQLEYLMSIPDITTVGELRNHPTWDPLRDHPRYQALLEKYEKR